MSVVNIESIEPSFWDDLKLVVLRRAHCARNGTDSLLPSHLKSAAALKAWQLKQQTRSTNRSRTA